MNGFICGTCGYIAFDEAPEKCPLCGSPKSVFKEQDIIKTAEDEGPKEKHVPIIKVVKKCGLVGKGCTDVHVRIGDILHPMEPAHFIVFVDFYVDRKVVSRVRLTADSNPAASAHIKAGSGKLTVMEFCNIHGYWVNEADL